MEDEKKRKKNRKKKNKQQARTQADDTSSNAGETSAGEQQNFVNRHIESNGGVDETRSDKIINEDKGTNGSIPADIAKQNWLQEEVRLRTMLKQLLYEKDAYMQRQAELEMQIKQLQYENYSWHEKGMSLEQRITQLVQENASLSAEERNLQEIGRHLEKERALLAEKEDSSTEMIATLNGENTRLRLQVVELEQAMNNILQENRQLTDNISMLHSRIQDLERSLASTHSSVDAQKDVAGNDDLNAQIDAACALVEKLVTENAELVEKLNELYMELGPQRAAAEATSVAIPDYAAVRHPASGSSDDISSSAKSAQLFETVPIGDDRVVVSDDVDSDYVNMVRHSSETAVSGEIVQIPLDENEAQDLEAQTKANEQDEGVPLTDAPLIGAPFRLVSFVAKYVSGADLVSKNSSPSK